VDPVGIDVGDVGDQRRHAVARRVDRDPAGGEGPDARLLGGLRADPQSSGAGDAVHLGGVVRTTSRGQAVLDPGADLDDHLLGVVRVEVGQVVEDQAPCPR
jgi:hypothetical protein